MMKLIKIEKSWTVLVYDNDGSVKYNYRFATKAQAQKYMKEVGNR